MFYPVIKGVIRFSYPSEGGFANDFATLAEHKAFLYHRARLERRFALFETITLPGLRCQSDADFQLAVLIGEDLPDWAKTRLQDSLTSLPQARIVSLPRMNHYPATRMALEALPDGDATHVAGFRLDDDDAIHVSSVACIRRIAIGMAEIADSTQPFAISFNRGYFLNLSEQGHTVSEVKERSPIGIGLTLVVPRDQRSNIFRRNHRLLHQFYPCYTDVSQPMYIRTVHQDNDSGAVSTGQCSALSQDKIDAILTSDFGIDPASVMGL